MGFKRHVYWVFASIFVLWTSVLLAAIVQDWQQWLIFRDVHTHELIPLINPPPNNASRVQLLRMGPIPCSCQSRICGCCVFMDVEYFDFHRNGCMNMTYYPNDFAVGANMLWNGESVWSRNISGKNPPPLCLQMPIPYIPSMDMCVRMYDIYTPTTGTGYNIHMCMNWEFRTERAPLLILEFDCFRMGQDGWANIKPGTPNAGLPAEMGGGGEGMPAVEAPQGTEEVAGAVEAVAEESVGEAGENDDSKRNLTTTKKPPKKVAPKPSTAAPFLSLNVEELSSSSLIVPITTDKYSGNLIKSKENNSEIMAPNLNLNIKEFEDPNTRLSVLKAPETVVKIDIKLDTSNNTIIEKAKHVQFDGNMRLPTAKDAYDLNRDLEILIEDSTGQKTRDIGLDYDAIHNSIPDSAMILNHDGQHIRNRRETSGRGKRIRERPAKKKNKNSNSDRDNKRRNKNRNRSKNKNRDKHRNRNKLYAPTLSFNIVEMSQEYKSGKDKRPMMPGFHDDSRSTPPMPAGPPKEIVLTYPEPRGQRMHREHRTAENSPSCHAGSPKEPESNPIPKVRARKGYKVQETDAEEPSLEPEENPLSKRRARKLSRDSSPEQEVRSLPEGRAGKRKRVPSQESDMTSLPEGSARKRNRAPSQDPIIESPPEGRPRRGRRARSQDPESNPPSESKPRKGRRSRMQDSEVNPLPEVGVRRIRRSPDPGDSTAFPYRPVTEEPVTDAGRAQRTHRDRRSADEERARKPGKKNRRTTAHPSFVAPGLNLNVLEIEPGYGYNDRYKLDQTLTSMTTPATTMSSTTTPATTPMTPKPGPDIDININNLYIYLATFTTIMRNETLDEYESR